jgi:ABC-2 type transport system ATP-binding protein
MRTVLANGTTLVFVSHDLAAVEATCSRAVWLDNGVLRSDGPVRDVLNNYRDAIEEAAACESPVDSPVRLVKAQASGPFGAVAKTSGQLSVSAVLEAPWPVMGKCIIGVSQGTPSPIFVLRRDIDLPVGETEIRCEIEHLPLPAGRYYLWLGVFDRSGDVLPWHPTAKFDVMGPAQTVVPKAIVRQSPLHVDAQWEIERR